MTANLSKVKRKIENNFKKISFSQKSTGKIPDFWDFLDKIIFSFFYVFSKNSPINDSGGQ